MAAPEDMTGANDAKFEGRHRVKINSELELVSCSADDIKLRSVDMPEFFRWESTAGKVEAFKIAAYPVRSEFQLPLHTHDFAEVFWITEGEGQQVLQDQELPLLPGSLCFIHPKIVHTFRSSRQMILMNVAFPGAYYRWLTRGPQAARARDLFTASSSVPTPYRLGSTQLAQLNRLAADLLHAPQRDVHISKFLFALFCLLEEGDDFQIAPEAPDWLQAALQRIQEPEHARLGVPEFIHLAGRSPEHVSRVTRQWTGQPPQLVVREARLSLAARALTLSDEPILDIAADLGFENVGHFYNAFRQRFGCPPRQYRLQQRQLPSGAQLV